MPQASLSRTNGRDTRWNWGRKDEEYVADFCLVARRHLSPSEYRLFKYHFLLGANWKLCAWKLKLSRGKVFHGIYEIEAKLGRVFKELEPYALFPLRDYYTSVRQQVKPAARVYELVPAPMALKTACERYLKIA